MKFGLALLFISLATAVLADEDSGARAAKAQEHLNKSTAEVKADNDEGAALDLLACVAVNPSEKLLANCYRNLGVVQIRLGHLREGRNWFVEYLAHCTDAADCEKTKKIADKYSQATDMATEFVTAQVLAVDTNACRLSINKGTAQQVKQNAIVSIYRGSVMIDTGVVEAAQAGAAKIRFSNLHSCEGSAMTQVKVAAGQ